MVAYLSVLQFCSAAYLTVENLHLSLITVSATRTSASWLLDSVFLCAPAVLCIVVWVTPCIPGLLVTAPVLVFGTAVVLVSVVAPLVYVKLNDAAVNVFGGVCAYVWFGHVFGAGAAVIAGDVLVVDLPDLMVGGFAFLVVVRVLVVGAVLVTGDALLVNGGIFLVTGDALWVPGGYLLVVGGALLMVGAFLVTGGILLVGGDDCLVAGFDLVQSVRHEVDDAVLVAGCAVLVPGGALLVAVGTLLVDDDVLVTDGFVLAAGGVL